MLKETKNIIIIGYGLSFLYGLSAVFSWGNLGNTLFRGHALVIMFFFLALFGCSLAVARLQEWGRRLMVIINGVMCVYLIGLFMQYPAFVQPGYIFVNIAAVLFFSQRMIRARFQSDFTRVRKSILVIDDDEAFIKTLKRVLLSNGYSVLTAATGEKGLQVAKLQRPDLILLDVILPGIKGREVCETLKKDEQTGSIPVIFLTAKDSPEDIKAELEAGADSHLTKPLESRVLLRAIKKTLGANRINLGG